MPLALPVEDRIAIHDLVTRYAWALSTGDADAFVGVFTRDGRIEDRGSGRSGQGPEGLRRFIAGALAKVGGLPRQYQADHVEINPSPGDAGCCRVRSFWQIHRTIDGLAKPYLIGHYDDVCVREASGWKFAHRVATAWHGDKQPWVDSPAQLPPLPAGAVPIAANDLAPAADGLTPLDWAQIHQLFGRYAWALDTGDTAAFPRLFTPDAWIDDRSTGRMDLPAFARTMAARPEQKGRQHYVSNLLMQGTTQQCTVRSFWTIVEQGNDKGELFKIGHYFDHCVKSGGDWLLSSRLIRPWQDEWVPWASREAAAAAGGVFQ